MQNVRKIVWNNDDAKIQLSAMMALEELDDEEGLSEIAQKHKNENISNGAQKMLDFMCEYNTENK
jgi:hypothetical protein